VVHFARDPEIRDHIVFLENYDISVARYLVQGCDVWLNTPRRPNEASGTSGMKLLPNGGLNLSILDGWWDEAYTPEVGWPSAAARNTPTRTTRTMSSRGHSITCWNTRSCRCSTTVTRRHPARLDRQNEGFHGEAHAYFQHQPMVAEYAEKFYIPAHERHLRLAAEHGKRVYQLVEWRKRLRAHGSEVKITDISSEHPADVVVGSKFKVTARIVLGGVVPGDVQVQLYYGNVDSEGRIVAGKTAGMSLANRPARTTLTRAKWSARIAAPAASRSG